LSTEADSEHAVQAADPNTGAPNIDDRAIDDRAIDDRAIDDRAIDDRAIDDRAIDDRAIDDRAIDDRAIDDRAIDDRAIDDRAIDDRAIDDRDIGSEQPDHGAGIFPGDCGQLPLDTRRVLVQLLLGPAVDARTKSNLWPVLLRDEAAVRSRLHDLFLDLVIDRDQRVAFTRQIADDDLDIPVLLRRANLTFLESALLLLLRQRLTQADTQGERAVIAWQDMQEHLDVFKRIGSGDHARFSRQIDGAVEKAKKIGLLRKIPGSDGRYEISPTLKLLFTAEEVHGLMRVYAGLTGEQAAADADHLAAADGDGEDDAG
jgi:hypothetical protein